MEISGTRARRIAVAACLALIGIGLAAWLLGASRETGYRALWAAAFALLTAGGYKFLSLTDRRERCYSGIFALLFCTAQALGYRLSLKGETGVAALCACVGIGLCLSPAVGYVCSLLISKPRTAVVRASLNPNRVFWISFAVILLCWIPVFLAYYPGLFAYDVNTQISEVVQGKLTNRNPLLHTLLLGAAYKLGGALGSYNLGIAIHVVLQMLAMAAAFAWLNRYMATLGCGRALIVVSALMYALLPINSMLAISCTKDTLFAGALLLFTIRLHRLANAPSLIKQKRYCVVTLLNAILLCLLRHNAFWGVAICAPLGLIVMPKELRKRLVLCALAALVAALCVTSAQKAIWNAGSISSNELISIPAQQMARVYAHGDPAEPDCQEIESLIPMVGAYNPRSSDAIKSSAIVNSPSRMWSFIKLWGRVGLSNPVTYIDAFLQNTQGYWWLDDATHASIYGEGLETRQGYLLTDTKEGYGVEHESLFPALETLYERLFSANEYQRVPVLSLLFAPSFWLWLCGLLLCGAMYRRRRAALLPVCFLLGYFVPFLFGACVIIRYVYPIIVCMPLLVFDAHKPCGAPKACK